MPMNQNSQVDIKLSRSPFGLQKLWPTLVYVHIATEVLETLHPGVTGLCFIIKVWLVTLIGLTNSLSTSNFSYVHVFLIKAVNSLEECRNYCSY